MAKGNTTTKSSFTVISSKPKANKNALGAAAKLAAKGKMVSDFAARTSVSEQNKRITTVEKGAWGAMAKKGTIYVSGSKKQFKKLKKLIVKSGLPKGVKVKRA